LPSAQENEIWRLMFRIPAFIPVALALSIAQAMAQDPSPELRELRELRALLEQQSKRLESLQEQLAELRGVVAKEKSTVEAGAGTTGTPEPAQGENPKPSPAPSPSGTPQPGLPEGRVSGEIPKEIPRAEAVPSSTRHTVVKGETLTSISRHYNISVSDLQRINKIENDRKLQIGQSLTIPLPKSSETQPQKSP
jgi:LysM repeat protein